MFLLVGKSRTKFNMERGWNENFCQQENKLAQISLGLFL